MGWDESVGLIIEAGKWVGGGGVKVGLFVCKRQSMGLQSLAHMYNF